MATKEATTEPTGAAVMQALATVIAKAVPLTAEQKRAISEQNEREHRELVARTNREAGKPEPKPGDSLYVATANGIKLRGRAGLLFSQKPAEVKIVDASDEDVRAKQIAGAYIVNPWGAEQILDDSNAPDKGLTVFGSSSDASASSLENASEDELEAALAKRRAAKREGSPERIGSKRRDKPASGEETPKG